MSGFLNSFMGKHQKLSHAKAKEFESEFISMIDLVDKALGKKAFRPAASPTQEQLRLFDVKARQIHSDSIDRLYSRELFDTVSRLLEDQRR